uniref:FYVE-type domain-containing protein n=1 Tax=Photinus pyralis TaxID=7054 RepID=A0A1Y1NBS9_PHOPY
MAMAQSPLDTDIQEGFICPVCYKDYRSSSNLFSHFVELHSEEQDLLKSIKDLVGKAKKRILKIDEKDLELFKNEISLQEFHWDYTEPQEPGVSRKHTDFFKIVRRERLDHRTSETNRLIIRLDKLLHINGSDRKQQEQELVTWLDGTAVSRCPSCAATFNITRRQHHCRLCGSVMCNLCSCFLACDVAKMIVTNVYTDRDNSSSKVEDNIRLCTHCMNMLESRNQVQMIQGNQPLICQLYDRLQKTKIDLQESINLYEKMCNSLMSSEDTFHLKDAQSLRASIAQQAEVLDIISKQIMSISSEDNQPKLSLLKNAIRQATTRYIKEYLLVLPNPAELDKMRKNRTIKHLQAVELPKPVSLKKIAVTTGWSPENLAVQQSVTDTPNDPLEEQIKIVQNYIEQARSANRYEEVVSLEENLKFLKEAYRMNQIHSDINV